MPKNRDQGIRLNGYVKSRIVAVFIQEGGREGIPEGGLEQDGGAHQLWRKTAPRTYTLNMRREEQNTVFYSYLARFTNTVTLNMYMFLSDTGLTTRNTSFVFVWLRPRNT